jgi:Gram-negative bacterial TonB protein C-terminal
MASATFHIFRRPGPDTRLGMALLASAMLHALVLTSLSKHVFHVGVLSRPANIALSVRIEKLPELPAKPGAVPILLKEKKAVFRQKLTVSAPVPITAPVHIEPSLPQPGVTVSETLFVRPIRASVSSPLLTDSAFRPTAELGEVPTAIAIKVPVYPAPAREKKTSGWVVVLLFLDEQGDVVDTVAVESSESFDEYRKDVAEGLRGSVFTPGKLDGREVRARVFIMVRFDGKGALSSLESANELAPVPPENTEKH